MKFTVPTLDLASALRSVALHVQPDADDPHLHRVRLDRGPDALTVSATNRYTIGHSFTQITDQGDGELGQFDLSPEDVAEIIAVFAKTAKDVPGHALEFDVTAEHTAIRDVSGLFDGKQLTLPLHPFDQNYPPLAEMITAKVGARDKAAAANRVVLGDALLGLFVKSAAIFGTHTNLVIDTAGKDNTGSVGPLLITCGDRFIGLLYPVHLSDDYAAQINGWQLDWLLRTHDQVPAGA